MNSVLIGNDYNSAGYLLLLVATFHCQISRNKLDLFSVCMDKNVFALFTGNRVRELLCNLTLLYTCVRNLQAASNCHKNYGNKMAALKKICFCAVLDVPSNFLQLWIKELFSIVVLRVYFSLVRFKI